MKSLKNIISVTLAFLLTVTFLSGCFNDDKKRLENIVGVWESTISESEEQAVKLLKNIDLSEDEIALCGNALKCVKVQTFTAEGEYRVGYNPDKTRECVKDFYKATFKTLYKNRSKLNTLYSEEFSSLNEEEFNKYFAQAYRAESFEKMLDYFADNAYDYEKMDDASLQSGSFEISGNTLLRTKKGESEAKALKYSIKKGKELTLKYSDRTERYIKNE